MTRKQNGSKRIEFNRRTLLKTATVAGVGISGVTAFSGGVAAHPPGCDVLVSPTAADADATTVQGGVAAASAGDTVCVAEDTYEEQVVINKDLTLTNVPGDSPTIVAPSDPGDFTIPESRSSSWEPVVFAFGGSESGGDVSGAGTVNVSISGVTVDGAGRQPNTESSSGVLLRNVKGTPSDEAKITDNVVENMGVGGKQTFGILAFGDSDVLIRDNDVSEYERGGIAGVGDGGDHPAPTVEISNNTVTGSTGIGEGWAPNGIEVGFGAEGTIRENDVSDNRYSEDGQAASGIIVFESDGVQVKKNSVTNSDVGIASGAWGWFLPSADGTKITRNDIHKANFGVILQAGAFEGTSTTDPSVSNNKVTNNTLTDPDPSDGVGVAIQAFDTDPDFDPVMQNNKVIHNSITGFDDQIDDQGSGTKVHP